MGMGSGEKRGREARGTLQILRIGKKAVNLHLENYVKTFTTMHEVKNASLILEDGTVFKGKSFGYPGSTAGEVVFNTAMTGYPESLTDPSYEGQILITTYPILGNYGVPPRRQQDDVSEYYESDHIHARAIVAQDYSWNHSHWQADRSLADWLNEEKIPGIYGIDTRALTKLLREKGSMLGKIVVEGEEEPDFYDPNKENLVAKVSCKEVEVHGKGEKKVVLVDCGVKHNIIRCLTRRGLTVVRVPWDYDFNTITDADGIFISNGPGNPDMVDVTVDNLRKAMQGDKPICGICMGNQLLSRAAGASVYKLKYGHRSHNQPVRQAGTGPLLRDFAEPRFRRRRQDTSHGMGTALYQYERRHQRGYPPQDETILLGAVPSRGKFGSEGH